MSWVFVDDHANEHEKLVEAGGEAAWLWACGLMYCNRQKKRTGFIVAAVAMRGLCANISEANTVRSIRQLVDIGLWLRLPDGFLVRRDDVWGYYSEREPFAPGQRARIIERDGLICGLCKGQVALNDIHIDHILPVILGGRNEDENLRVTHSTCNLRRSKRPVEYVQ